MCDSHIDQSIKTFGWKPIFANENMHFGAMISIGLNNSSLVIVLFVSPKVVKTVQGFDSSRFNTFYLKYNFTYGWNFVWSYKNPS